MSLLLKNGSVHQKNGAVNHSDASARAPQATPLGRSIFGTRAILLAQKPFSAPLPSAIEFASDPAPTLEWLNQQFLALNAAPTPTSCRPRKPSNNCSPVNYLPGGQFWPPPARLRPKVMNPVHIL
jgi:hypothetical protein